MFLSLPSTIKSSADFCVNGLFLLLTKVSNVVWSSLLNFHFLAIESSSTNLAKVIIASSLSFTAFAFC